MHYSLDEQESFVRYDAETKKFSFESTYPPEIKRLLAMDCLEDIDVDTDINVKTGEKQVTSIRGNLKPSFRMTLVPKKRRVLTDAQKKRLMQNWNSGTTKNSEKDNEPND